MQVKKSGLVLATAIVTVFGTLSMESVAVAKKNTGEHPKVAELDGHPHPIIQPTKPNMEMTREAVPPRKPTIDVIHSGIFTPQG